MGVIKKPFKVGLATFAQPTFDVAWADSIRKETLEMFTSLGIETVALDRPLMYEQEAYQFRDQLREANVDAVFLQSGGFSFGGLPVIIGTGLDVPCIVWSTPEPEWTGGIIRSNSLCAGIMNNSHLKRMGVNPHFIFGNPEELRPEIEALVKAMKAKSYLRNAKMGIVGYRAPGFYASTHDEVKLQAELGIQTFHIDLSSLLREVEQIEDCAAERIVADYGMRLDQPVAENFGSLLKSVKVYLSLKKMAEEQSLDILAIKCWPEFPVEQNVAVCLALSLLNNDGIITACEADGYGAVTMLIQDLLGEGPEFFNDLIQTDPEKNEALFWHCGAAAAILRDPDHEAVIKPQGMRRKIGAVNFPLKPGKVTVSRLTNHGDGWKMFLATGDAVKTPMLLEGTPSLVKMDSSVDDLVETIIAEGFEHHYSTIYGDISKEIEWFCKLTNIRLVKP